MRAYGRVASLVALVLMVGLSPIRSAHAVTAQEIDASVKQTLDTFYQKVPEAKDAVDKAAGVLVFPEVTKAGLIVGGQHGVGALMVDGKITGYYETSGASIGLQAGYEDHSEVYVFNDQQALDQFRKKPEWQVGADAQVTVVDASAGGSITPSDPVVAYVFGSEGLMAGITVKGSRISEAESVVKTQ